MDSLYIVIPAYNEEANIKQTIDDWYPVVEKRGRGGTSRLVIIDDGSKDSTYSIMQEYAKDRPLFTPLTKPNGGHGPTVLYGYRYAIKNNVDYVFQTDSDGQTNPQEFEAFWDSRNDYDAVLSSHLKVLVVQRINYCEAILKGDFMISGIVNSKDCTGCGCCKESCPMDCISMVEDKMGFQYPFIDNDKCIKCGTCLNSCPSHNKTSDDNMLEAYVVQAKERELLLQSSSGGYSL